MLVLAVNVPVPGNGRLSMVIKMSSFMSASVIVWPVCSPTHLEGTAASALAGGSIVPMADHICRCPGTLNLFVAVCPFLMCNVSLIPIGQFAFAKSAELCLYPKFIMN